MGRKKSAETPVEPAQQQPLFNPPEQPQEPPQQAPQSDPPGPSDEKPVSKMDAVRQALKRGIEGIADIVAYAAKHGYVIDPKTAGVYKSNIKRAGTVATSRTKHPSETRQVAAPAPQGPTMEDVISSLVDMREWCEANGGLESVLESFSVVEMCRQQFGSYDFCRSALLAIRRLMG